MRPTFHRMRRFFFPPSGSRRGHFLFLVFTLYTVACLCFITTLCLIRCTLHESLTPVFYERVNGAGKTYNLTIYSAIASFFSPRRSSRAPVPGTAVYLLLLHSSGPFILNLAYLVHRNYSYRWIWNDNLVCLRILYLPISVSPHIGRPQ